MKEQNEAGTIEWCTVRDARHMSDKQQAEGKRSCDVSDDLSLMTCLGADKQPPPPSITSQGLLAVSTLARAVEAIPT